MPIKSVKEMVAEAKAGIETLTSDAAQAEVDQGKAMFVDIRDPRELERDGKIPGAFHAPRGMLEFWIDPASPYHKPELLGDRRLILYCASAWRSALSAKTLKDMGLDTVAELDGGFSSWKKSGRPVEG
ncbi:MAG: rhodanese-like domain-containing protein [Rhodobacteraceae bacterium]|nr:rhodanese-like domain-containing protein [Paracoccaceae bacterium]